MMHERLDEAALNTLFREARSQKSWQAEPPLDEGTLRTLYDLAKWGPTSSNSSPARFIFVVTPEGKEKLRPAIHVGNVDQTMTAPATVVIGYDTRFYEHLPELFPHQPAAPASYAREGAPHPTAFRNASLQGGYLIIAARALGLDVCPISGFDESKVNAAFWPDGRVRANFLCNIGHGDDAKIYPRGPRLSFEQACKIV